MSKARPTWRKAMRASAASPGVVLVTSGPGATNAVTGIADAYMDSTPMVVITGQVPTALIGNDAFQEVDIVGITRPCTKHNYLVKEVEDVARDHQGSVLYRGQRTPGSGGGRSAQRRADGRAHIQASRQGRIARLQADDSREIRARSSARSRRSKRARSRSSMSAAACNGRAPRLSCATRARTRNPGHRNADGARIDPGVGFAAPRDARDAWLVRHQHGGTATPTA